MSVASGEGPGRGRGAARAAWCGEGGAAVRSGRGRPGVGERWWPGSSAAAPMAERACELLQRERVSEERARASERLRGSSGVCFG
jgi:hypothetical protein